MVAFKRCCAGIQNRNPEQPRDCLPHHACLEQPLPSQQGTHTAPPVRPRLQPRRLSWESQRGPGGTPRPSSEGGAREEEDQSGEWVFAFGHALPDPGLGPRPVLHLHHCQRGENVQVRGLCRTAARPLYRIIQAFSAAYASLCAESAGVRHKRTKERSQISEQLINLREFLLSEGKH